MAMGMVREGHVVHAKAMYNEDFHLAWGDLPDDYPEVWSIEDTPPPYNSGIVNDSLTRSTDSTDQLPNTGVISIAEVYELDDESDKVIYVKDTDYQLTENYVEWLTGGNAPTEGSSYFVNYRLYDVDITQLISELGRREPTRKEYVYQDENGSIVANDTTWSISTDPTESLYLQFKFDADEALDNTIYQIALFINTVKESSVGAGVMYLTPGDVQDPGLLYMIENVKPFSRTAGKREIFEFVISF